MASGAVTAASARSDATPPVPTRRWRVRSGLAKKSPWKDVKPSARQRCDLLRRGDAGRDELEAALERLGDQRARSSSSVRPATESLTSEQTSSSASSKPVERERVAAELAGGRSAASSSSDTGAAAIWSTTRSGRTGGVPTSSRNSARHRQPRGMAAGEPLEPDVAERVEQQPGGRRGALAVDDELVSDDRAVGVGDRAPDDGDLVRIGSRLGRRHRDASRPAWRARRARARARARGRPRGRAGARTRRARRTCARRR